MNRIPHGRKNVVGKQKYELNWKIISVNQISSYVIKMLSKKARLLETERFIEIWQADKSLWNILSDWSDNYKIGKRKKSVERILEKLEMTSK